MAVEDCVISLWVVDDSEDSSLVDVHLRLVSIQDEEAFTVADVLIHFQSLAPRASANFIRGV